MEKAIILATSRRIRHSVETLKSIHALPGVMPEMTYSVTGAYDFVITVAAQDNVELMTTWRALQRHPDLLQTVCMRERKAE